MQGAVQPPLSSERAILDAAKELFCSRGFAATGVAAIGAKVGISGPAIYRHFKSKDEILVALCFEALDALMAQAHEVTADPRRDLKRLIRCHARVVLHDRPLASIYFTEYNALEPLHSRLLDRRLGRYVEQWIDVLTRCWPTEDREQLTSAAYAAMGSANSVILWPEAAFETEVNVEDIVVEISLAALSILDRELVEA